MSSNTPEFSEKDIDLFLRGYAHCYDIVLTDIENLKESLNAVMGVYLDRESVSLVRNGQTPNEAVVTDMTHMHELLTHLTARLEDAYFARLDDIKANPAQHLEGEV